MSDWKKCLMCDGELIRLREAYWECIKCKISYAACEEDMKKNV